jgi:hypothetical protein
MVKDLEEILTAICNDARKDGIPICATKLELYLWLDTKKDNFEPIIGKAEVDFKETMNEKQCLDFVRAINFVTPISMIITEGHPFRTYHVTKIEEFMKKPCEGC